jgi:hypothetical protein
MGAIARARDAVSRDSGIRRCYLNGTARWFTNRASGAMP